jgi:hypothetical protein
MITERYGSSKERIMAFRGDVKDMKTVASEGMLGWEK